jgi:chromosome segregation ATPase
MSGGNKALVVALVASLGLWGCARGPANSAAERIKALEYKVDKLEEDFRAAAAARDILRQKLTSVEEQRTRLENQVTQLQLVVKERDELRKQFAARTGERDALQAQYEQFRKSIRDLLGQAETAASAIVPQPVTVASSPQAPGKS